MPEGRPRPGARVRAPRAPTPRCRPMPAAREARDGRLAEDPVALWGRSAFPGRSPSMAGDGAFAVAGGGGFGLGASVEWIRFGPGGGPGFRRTSYALALGGDTLALGAAFHLYGGSSSPLYNSLTSWDVGIAARPWRALS